MGRDLEGFSAWLILLVAFIAGFPVHILQPAQLAFHATPFPRSHRSKRDIDIKSAGVEIIKDKYPGPESQNLLRRWLFQFSTPPRMSAEKEEGV